MKTQMKKTVPPPGLRVCLAKIRAGQMKALLLLADRLEVSKHPLAEVVRGIAQEWQDRLQQVWTMDYCRRQSIHWRLVACWHRFYRQKVLRAFGEKRIAWPNSRPQYPRNNEEVACSGLSHLFHMNAALCRSLFGPPHHEHRKPGEK